MNIEGGEWPILEDPRLREFSAHVVVIERHANGCPTQDARDHAGRLLYDAGYIYQHL